jgi:hypothetical protein
MARILLLAVVLASALAVAMGEFRGAWGTAGTHFTGIGRLSRREAGTLFAGTHCSGTRSSPAAAVPAHAGPIQLWWWRCQVCFCQRSAGDRSGHWACRGGKRGRISRGRIARGRAAEPPASQPASTRANWSRSMNERDRRRGRTGALQRQQLQQLWRQRPQRGRRAAGCTLWSSCFVCFCQHRQDRPRAPHRHQAPRRCRAPPAPAPTRPRRCRPRRPLRPRALPQRVWSALDRPAAPLRGQPSSPPGAGQAGVRQIGGAGRHMRLDPKGLPLVSAVGPN